MRMDNIPGGTVNFNTGQHRLRNRKKSGLERKGGTYLLLDRTLSLRKGGQNIYEAAKSREKRRLEAGEESMHIETGRSPGGEENAHGLPDFKSPTREKSGTYQRYS